LSRGKKAKVKRVEQAFQACGETPKKMPGFKPLRYRSNFYRS
jgi:hypothetical protein